MKISFIGTGLMGFPMSKNLLKKDLDLKIFSRTIEKAKPLEKFGGKVVNSLSEVVIESEIIFTMLTDDDAVEKVLGNKDFLKNRLILREKKKSRFWIWKPWNIGLRIE